MKQIFSIGMSPFIMNVCACCIVIFINYQLLSHGDDYSVGAFGIINRVQMLFVMIVMGIAQGMQPITGYNFGAGLVDRARRSVQARHRRRMHDDNAGIRSCSVFPGNACRDVHRQRAAR